MTQARNDSVSRRRRRECLAQRRLLLFIPMAPSRSSDRNRARPTARAGAVPAGDTEGAGSDDSIRAKSFIVTVLGDSIAPAGGELWLATLIALLEPFGLNERLVRTSVFRLVDEGWLSAERVGRRSLYRLTADGLRRIDLAEQRIYFPAASAWDGLWTLVVAGPGLAAPALRALRRELEWEGFAVLSAGVFGHPGDSTHALVSLFAGLAGAGTTTIFRAQSTQLPGIAGLTDDRSLVARHWPLADLAERYREFQKRFAGLSGGPPLAPAAAFAARSLMIHAYRRLVLHDPQLPLDLLPRDWPGRAAYELARTLYRSWEAPAHEHLSAMYVAAGASAPPQPRLNRFPPS